jgi:single-strand DNA-binding protein
MWRSRSKFVLMGSVDEDPVVRFRVALSETFRDESGRRQERTGWHNVVAWQHLAELVGEYVRKGTRVYVEGQLQIARWDNQTGGEKKEGVEILAHQILLLDGTQVARDEDRPRADEHSDVGKISDDELPF